jgi:formylglycine-generating enzyme required for sulfatase activity
MTGRRVALVRRSVRMLAAVVVGALMWPVSAAAQIVTCEPKEVRPSLVRIERGPNLRGSGVVIVRRETYVVILSVKHVMGGESENFTLSFAVAPNRRIPARWNDDSIVVLTQDSELVAFRVDTQVPEGVEAEDPFVGVGRAGASAVSWGYPSAGTALCSYESKLDAVGAELAAVGEVPEGVSGGPMFVLDPDDNRRPKLAAIVVRGDAGHTYGIDIGIAARLVNGEPHRANKNRPYRWPNIPLPQQLLVKSIPNLSFQRVAAGPFLMGSNTVADERWKGPPPMLESFYMGTYEVTRGQYSQCVAAMACRRLTQSEGSSPQESNLPVVNVSWEDAKAYTTWLQRRLTGSPDAPPTLRRLFDAGWTVVLPSEAEWEKAARKFDPVKNVASVYPWGERPHDGGANFNTNRLRPVNESKCNDCAYGLFDMTGNVWEWTRSLKVPYPYSAAAADRPSAPGNRVIRGGSYKREDNAPTAETIVRSSNREEAPPTKVDQYIGFRVALICARDGDMPCAWEEAD